MTAGSRSQLSAATLPSSRCGRFSLSLVIYFLLYLVVSRGERLRALAIVVFLCRGCFLSAYRPRVFSQAIYHVFTVSAYIAGVALTSLLVLSAVWMHAVVVGALCTSFHCLYAHINSNRILQSVLFSCSVNKSCGRGVFQTFSQTHAFQAAWRANSTGMLASFISYDYVFLAQTAVVRRCLVRFCRLERTNAKPGLAATRWFRIRQGKRSPQPPQVYLSLQFVRVGGWMRHHIHEREVRCVAVGCRKYPRTCLPLDATRRVRLYFTLVYRVETSDPHAGNPRCCSLSVIGHWVYKLRCLPSFKHSY